MQFSIILDFLYPKIRSSQRKFAGTDHDCCFNYNNFDIIYCVPTHFLHYARYIEQILFNSTIAES